MALALRLGLSKEDLKDMSFVSLYNILVSCTNQEKERAATEADVDRILGR